MYIPPDEIVPFVESPPPTPFTLQVTFVLDEPFTVAVNCCVWEIWTEAFEGDTVTEITGGPLETTVTRAFADFDESVVLTAETKNEEGDGRTAGAV